MGFLRYFTLADRNQRFLTFFPVVQNFPPALKARGEDAHLGLSRVYLVEMDDRIFGEHIAIDVKLEIIRRGAK